MASVISARAAILVVLSFPTGFIETRRLKLARADSDDYYEILGVSRNAGEEDLRRAYKRKALDWHPDKNRNNEQHAEEMFKKVSEAYQVLSDPQQRAAYDRFGKDGVGGGASGFGGGSGFGRGDDFFYWDPLELFEQIFRDMASGDGATFQFGDGTFTFSFSSGGPPPGFEQWAAPEPPEPVEYDLTLSLEDVFTGVMVEHEDRHIQIPPGVEDGQVLTTEDGVYTFKVRVEEHPEYEREHLNLVRWVCISFLDYLMGADYAFKSIDGHRVRVHFPRCSLQPVIKRQRGLWHASGRHRGSLIVRPCFIHPKFVQKVKSKLRFARNSFGLCLILMSTFNPQLLVPLALLASLFAKPMLDTEENF